MSTLVSLLQSGLVLFHSAFGDWGLTIMGVTFLLRLLLFPLQAVGSRHQTKRREGIKGPLIFLAIFVQLPIFLAMYRAINSAPFLTNAHFLWITSLASPDRIFLLPIFVAAIAYCQQRSSALRTEIKIPRELKWMPALNFIFMAALPSGVVLYYATSSVLQLLGDLAVKKWIS